MVKERTKISRRRFNQLTGAGLAVAALGMPSIARGATPRLVVVGGGPAGGTVARYVARDSKGAVGVTLIEANPMHTTCFFSNLYLGGLVSWDSIQHGYDTLRDDYGVDVMQATAMAVDVAAKQVVLGDGSKVDYDKVAVAPGIDFQWEAYEGLDEALSNTKVPHAYKAGPQTELLNAQLEAMEDGGTVVIAAPPNPFRCPPGPYERASMIAMRLSKTKPNSKVIIVDAKQSHSKQALFQEGWARYYPGMVEWVSSDFIGGPTGLDPSTLTLKTSEGEDFKADVMNFIPAQKAGKVVMASELNGGEMWAPVDSKTLQSKLDKDVYVLGDACANGDMPKSGFSANSQAKACAMAIRAELTGSRAFPPRFRNTCWSMIAEENAVKVGANYEATAEKIEKIDGFISQTGETDAVRYQTMEEAYGWYEGITKDIFG